LNAGGGAPDAQDLDRGLRIYGAAWLLLAAGLAVLAFARRPRR
jgi:hypothetical protein